MNMTHAQIAANARKPYADAISKLQRAHDELVAALRETLGALDQAACYVADADDRPVIDLIEAAEAKGRAALAKVQP